jgi:hypothetical protein
MDGPSDTVSIAHGNGFDLCGNRTYTIYNEDGEIYNEGIFKIKKDEEKALSGAESL